MSRHTLNLRQGNTYLRDCIEHSAGQGLGIRVEDGSDQEIRDGEERIGACRVEDVCQESCCAALLACSPTNCTCDKVPLTCIPVDRVRGSSHHRQRRADRDRTADYHEPVCRYLVDEVTYGQVTDNSSNRSRQEVDGSLCSRVLLDVLEVESQHGFDRVETSPSEEDCDADGCEDPVSPEGVGNDGWFAQSLLTANVPDEGRYER